MSDRTRTFEGTYTTKDNRQTHLNVKIFRRFAAFVLSFTLIQGAGLAISNNTNKSGEATFNAENYQQDDRDLIAKILNENPNILKNVEDVSYTIKDGDTLASIAHSFGITPDKICYLNNMTPESTLYVGGAINVQKITPKEGDDELIAALESYFYDYVFKSPAASIASSKDAKDRSQFAYYKDVIFGNPKSEADVDPNSIYGRYILAYIAYHDGKTEHTLEETKNYIDTLATLAVDLEDALNLHNTVAIIVTFEGYRNFLRNGVTIEAAEPTPVEASVGLQKLSI